jgi:hypothetical protein
MLAPPSDRPQSPPAFEPLLLQDPVADIGRTARRPTWWLDEEEHARLMGVKPRAKTPDAPRTRFTVKPRSEPPRPAPAPEKAEALPVADFSTLVPTLSALDRILQPLAADVPGIAPLLNRRIKRIGRLGAALGLATLAAAVVFFQ